MLCAAITNREGKSSRSVFEFHTPDFPIFPVFPDTEPFPNTEPFMLMKVLRVAMQMDIRQSAQQRNASS